MSTPPTFDGHLPRRKLLLSGAAATATLIGLPGCNTPPAPAARAPAPRAVQPTKPPLAISAVDRQAVYRAINRLGWGATIRTLDHAVELGYEHYVEDQLRADRPAQLPPAVQARIDALTIQRTALPALMRGIEARRRTSETAATEEARKAAQQAYQQELGRLARESAHRHLLRAVYSQRQLQEHLTWFWFNHFNVYQGKGALRALVGDYEEQAIRPNALGRFRDLLGAVVRHPAMLRYLDNDQNALRRINENHARELLELHTMGVISGYQQRDVQELARVLTGLGVSFNDKPPRLTREQEPYFLARGGFEFNPNRHDFGAKTLLGQPLKARGLAEVDEALDLIASQPSTARFISRKLAQFLWTDEPPASMVERMAAAFRSSDGRIDATLRVLLLSPEFMASGSPPKFKDPMHFVVSAVRASYEDREILSTQPMQNWLNRMGQGLYNRQTPDGYLATAAGWTSSGQMSTRFDIARTIGNGSAGLFKPDDSSQPAEKPGFPQLANALYFDVLRATLGPDTRKALEQAPSPQDWNTLFLSSPEFMYR